MTRILTSLLASSIILSNASAQNGAIRSRVLQMSEPSCNMDGSRLVCSNIMSMMEDMEGNSVSISSTVSCESSPSLFDFRRAEGCTCTAEVTTGSETKLCGCSVCPAGYGMNPLSVDCGDLDDPYIVDTCTKLDCNFECDGACTSGCDVDPLPAECVSLCTRDAMVEPVAETDLDTFIETASDVPSDIPSDMPSDVPSDMPSDVPSTTPTLSATTLAPASSVPSSSPISDPSSRAFSPHIMLAFACNLVAAITLLTL